MRLFLLIVLACAGLASPSFSREMDYHGFKPENARGLERKLKHLERSGLGGSELADSAVAWLELEGYIDASAASAAGELHINAGRRARLKRLVLEPDSGLVVAVNMPFTQKNLSATMDELLGRFCDSGYYYVHVTVAELARDGDDISVHLNLNRGPKVEIATRIYSGLKQSRPEILGKYISLREGDTLTESGLKRAEMEAASIPFVRYQLPALVHPRPGYTQTDVEFRFEERRRFRLFGGAGYVPDDVSGLVWNIDLKLMNLFGGGKEVAVRSERRERGRNKLDVSYRQPLFLFGTGCLGLTAATRDYRDDFYEFSVGGRYRSRFSGTIVIGLGFAWKRVAPAHGASSYSAYAADFSIERSSLDNTLNPTRGYALDMSVAYVYRQYDGAGGVSSDRVLRDDGRVFNETRSYLTLRVFRCLISRIIGHIGLNYAGLETDESQPPISELTLIGGPGTLRGYRNEQFMAQRTAFGTIEPRMRFQRGYLFAFYDAAYISRRLVRNGGRTATEELYRDGYGVGLALQDSVRSVKLSLGWSEEAGFDQPRLSIEFSSDL